MCSVGGVCMFTSRWMPRPAGYLLAGLSLCASRRANRSWSVAHGFQRRLFDMTGQGEGPRILYIGREGRRLCRKIEEDDLFGDTRTGRRADNRRRSAGQLRESRGMAGRCTIVPPSAEGSYPAEGGGILPRLRGVDRLPVACSLAWRICSIWFQQLLTWFSKRGHRLQFICLVLYMYSTTHDLYPILLSSFSSQLCQ